MSTARLPDGAGATCSVSQRAVAIEGKVARWREARFPPRLSVPGWASVSTFKVRRVCWVLLNAS